VTIEIRPVSGYADLGLWVAIRNEVIPEDPETAEAMALVRASELERVDLLAFLDGEPAGAGMIAGDPESAASTHPYAEVRVLHRLRGRGVGTALARALSDRARALGKLGFETPALAHDRAAIAYLERRGFVPVRDLDQWVLDLTRDDIPTCEPPEGVEIVWLADRPELLRGMYEVAAQTYHEVGGWVGGRAETERDWLLYEVGNPALPVELTPVAVAGERAIGFSTLALHPDGRTAGHRMLAVVPDWRRRGIARALICAQLHSAKAAGHTAFVSWRRGQTPERAYASLGFERRISSIVFKGPLL
jgi:GNAT superfamily N-acetyltransferase